MAKNLKTAHHIVLKFNEFLLDSPLSKREFKQNKYVPLCVRHYREMKRLRELTAYCSV